MPNNTVSTPSPKLLVCFYAEPNFLSLNILENLLAKNCLVNIITTESEAWKNLTPHISKNLFGITEQGKHFFDKPYSYSLYCAGFLSKENAYDNLPEFFNDPKTRNTKALILLPAEAYFAPFSENLEISDSFGIIYIGDVIGPRINLESDLVISKYLSEILYDRSLTLEIGDKFFPLFITDASRKISKWLFSFGPYGREVFLLGREVSLADFWKANKKLISDLEVTYKNNNDTARLIPKGYEVVNVDTNLNFCLVETYKWINNSLKVEDSKKTTEPLKPKIVNIPVPKPKKFVKPPVSKEVQVKKALNLKLHLPKLPKVQVKIKKPPRISRPAKLLIATVFLIITTPIVIFGSALGFDYFAYKQFLSGKFENVESSLLIAKTLFVASGKMSNALTYVPILGKPYREIVFSSSIGERVSNMGVAGLPMLTKSSGIFGKILGDEIYDPKEYTESLKEGLDYFYTEISVMQADTQNASSKGIKAANYLQSKVDFDRLKSISSKGSDILQTSPEMLGKGKPKSYLVLFQNNMELRPTGGFIGSYGLMNFDSGRMNELDVYDVYSADGQLKGHVEPPQPIKEHLGEANWWLRDSNWDPDFVTSAQRAEWFIDKEIDQKVDGVFAIDLEVIREILKYTGDIFLPDYNLTINSENLYEKTQEEVEKNFFPGSRKKQSFLTALSRSLITEITELDEVSRIKVLKSILGDLEKRHVQIYVHDEKAETAIKSIGWGGSVLIPTCGDDCYADFVGIVEANVGVNKSNYFIKRTVDLNINLSEGILQKKLRINYKNEANPQLGPSGKYKNYMRVLLPLEAESIAVRNITGGGSEFITPDINEVKNRKEVGVLIEVLGGRSESVEFSWDVPITPAINKYGLYIRKQAGISDDPWSIIFASQKGKIISKPEFSLTNEGRYKYNMTLIRDFVSLFVWQNDR